MAKLAILIFALVILIVFGVSYLSYQPNVNSLVTSNIKKNIIVNSPVLPKLTISEVFDDNYKVNNIPDDKKWILIATGDIIPARSVNLRTTNANDFIWPFAKTWTKLVSADLTVTNLEAPLINNCPATSEGMIFCGDSQNVLGLKQAGIKVVSLANNHAGNWGEKGLQDTVDLLAKNDIFATGINNIIYRNVKGTKIAFLGYNSVGASQVGLSDADPATIRKEIILAKQQANLVIVFFHWGVEYTSLPSQEQRDLAHLAIDSGADLILGNHPHWIQPVEFYHKKFITYAHGNFIFDQMWSDKTRQGVVGQYTFYGNTLIDVKFLPVQIDDFGQPYFMEGKQKQLILNEMEKNSLQINK